MKAPILGCLWELPFCDDLRCLPPSWGSGPFRALDLGLERKNNISTITIMHNGNPTGGVSRIVQAPVVDH